MNARGKVEEHTCHQEVLEEKIIEFRSELILQGKWDKMNILQPKTALTLKVGDGIQFTFRSVNDEQDHKKFMEWCTGTAM